MHECFAYKALIACYCQINTDESDADCLPLDVIRSIVFDEFANSASYAFFSFANKHCTIGRILCGWQPP